MSCPEKDASVHKSIAVSIFKRYKAHPSGDLPTKKRVVKNLLFVPFLQDASYQPHAGVEPALA